MLNIHRTITELRDAPRACIAGEKEQQVGADRWRRPAETEAVFDCADIFVNPGALMQRQEAGGLFCFCSGLPRLFLSL